VPPGDSGLSTGVCLRSLQGVSEQSARADNSAQGEVNRQAAVLSRAYLEALRAADAAGAYRIAARALADGMSLPGLYQDVIAPAMYEVGRLWERGALTVADEHLATALTHRVLGALRPPSFFQQSFDEDSGKPRAMLAAVQGEQHALGLRMAADLLEDHGHQTIYLGADVPTGSLLRAIESFSPTLLGLTATMPESAPRLADVIAAIREDHPQLRLLVGGQASASSRVEDATPVDDLELLAARTGAP
jgi:methanogenic corrinoid protein MtbC1